MTSQEQKIPEWLKRIQENSWEAEILISGAMIFGLLQAPEYLSDQISFINREMSALIFVSFALSLLFFATYILLLGFISHLVIRGIWIAYIGLSFCFSSGINKTKINYHKLFKNHVDKLPSIHQKIIKLENIASLIFSISFLLFLSFFGAALLFLSLIGIPTYIFDYYYDFDNIGNYINIHVIVIFLIFVYLIDFISFGLIKSIKWLAPIYYPIYIVFNYLSLAFIYKDIYYTLITNIKKKQLFVSFLIFFIIAFISIGIGRHSVNNLIVYSTHEDYNLNNSHYRDKLKKSGSPSIQSDIITNNTIKLFIPLHLHTEDWMREHCNLKGFTAENSTHKHGLADHGKQMINCIQQYHQIIIDQNEKENIKWFFHLNIESDKRGVISFIDISDLKTGIHQLKIKIPPTSENSHGTLTTIHFYKE